MISDPFSKNLNLLNAILFYALNFCFFCKSQNENFDNKQLKTNDTLTDQA